MNATICKAINDVSELGFTYKGVQRWVEPHTYGLQANGREALCAWQTSGGSGDGFRLFLVSEMSALAPGKPFGSPRPGYNPSDNRFTRIYAEL